MAQPKDEGALLSELVLDKASLKDLERGLPHLCLPPRWLEKRPPQGRKTIEGWAARLLGPEGKCRGTAVVDRGEGVLRIWSREPDARLDQAFFDSAVLSALKLRESLFGPFGRERDTNAYRLFNGDGDGLGGFSVDAYAGFLLVQVNSEAVLPWAHSLEEALERVLHPRGIVRKLRFEEKERGRVTDQVTHGEKPPEVLEVTEAGMRLEVELMVGIHTGLFSDMREEHVRLRNLARGRKVLNTFAYTGAFSVAAALGGAREVTSVDVVAKVLERARRNFRRAGLDPEAHRFARMEVLDYLRMAARRGWRFDAVVLDPPTFSSFKGGSWSSKTGYAELLAAALAVLERDGLLWAASNTEDLPPQWLEETLVRALEGSGRLARAIAIGGLPPDYPTPLALPEARYLKVFVLEVL